MNLAEKIMLRIEELEREQESLLAQLNALIAKYDALIEERSKGND